MAVQLFVYTLQQGPSNTDTDALAEVPDGVAIGHVHAVLCREKRW